MPDRRGTGPVLATHASGALGLLPLQPVSLPPGTTLAPAPPPVALERVLPPVAWTPPAQPPPTAAYPAAGGTGGKSETPSEPGLAFDKWSPSSHAVSCT